MKKKEITQDEQELREDTDWCFYSDLPSPLAYTKLKSTEESDDEESEDDN